MLSWKYFSMITISSYIKQSGIKSWKATNGKKKYLFKIIIFSDVHRISHEERIKAVIAATKDHFNYLDSLKPKQAETPELSKDSAPSKAQLEVVACFIADGKVLSLKVFYVTGLGIFNLTTIYKITKYIF